jgi:hypothetical protein
MTTQELPNKLSALLRVAVEDVQKCEADPRFELEMGMWVVGDVGPTSERCSVCMAGAVMVQRLGVATDSNSHPEDVPEAERHLLAIDHMRLGNFVSAHQRLSRHPASIDEERALRAATAKVRSDPTLEQWIDDDGDYSDPHAAWPVYLEAADILESAGL